VREPYRVAAVFQVDAHCDHSRNAGGDRRLHHFARIAQLLEVKVRIYEDAICSSSTTSSSRLKSASGCGRGWPGSSRDGFQRSTLS